MSTPFVRAVLVSDGRTDFLSATLAAVASSDLAPSLLHLILLNGADAPVPFGLEVEVSTSTATTYGEAVAEILAQHPAREGELLWLLHDDVAPAPDALDHLVATMGKRPRAAVVGAAHVRWRDSTRLVNLGTTVSRIGARRIGLVVEDDINQGQHDWREDVMAVSLAAALVRRDVWERLGGIDLGYRGFGDSVEFCRRAWATGHDVVVEPEALVRHAQASLYGARLMRSGRGATHARRRVSDWHHAFAWAPLWFVPFLVVMVPLSAILRVLLRIAQNVPRIALAELMVPFMLVTRAPAIAHTAAEHRRVGATGKIEGQLYASARLVVYAVRQRELGVFERSRAERVPTDLLKAELDRARATQRRGLAVVLLGTATAAAAIGVAWVRALAADKMISGPGVGTTALSAETVWSRAWTGWSDAGFGSPGIDGAFAGLMAPLAVLPGGMRIGFGALLVVAPLLAGIAAWRAAGHATRGPWMRVSAALVFALWPPFLGAILDARVGHVLAHIALAIVADALARATGWRRGELVGARVQLDSAGASPSAGLATALALTVATVAQPVLLVPVIAVLIMMGAFVRSVRWRLWGMLSVPVVVGLPGLVAAARHVGQPSVFLSILARDPGPGTSWSGDAWRVALGFADADRWAPLLQGASVLGMLGALVLMGAAFASLFSKSAWRAGVTGLALMGLGLAVSGWSASSTVAWPDNAGGGAVAGWPGAGSSLVALGALVAALATHGALMSLEGRRFAVGRVAGATLATLAVGSSLAAVAFMAWPGAVRGSAVAVEAKVLPLALPLDQDGPYRQRIMVLDQRDDGTVTFSVLSHDGTNEAIGRADLDPDGEPLGSAGASNVPTDSLARAVAEATQSGEAPLDALTAWGIGTLVVAPGADRIRSALDQNGALTMVGGSDRGFAYRIGDGSASRAWIETDAGRIPLRSTATEGTVSHVNRSGGTLVVAVPSGAGWRAWADGSELSTVDDALGRAAFAVPTGATHVSYAYRDPFQRWWWWAGAVAVAWALVGAVPLRRSREVAS